MAYINDHPRPIQDDGSWWKEMAKLVPVPTLSLRLLKVPLEYKWVEEIPQGYTPGEAVLSLLYLNALAQSIFLHSSKIPAGSQANGASIPRTRSLYDKIQAIHLLGLHGLTVKFRADLLTALIEADSKDFFVPANTDVQLFKNVTSQSVRLAALRSLGEHYWLINNSKPLVEKLVGKYALNINGPTGGFAQDAIQFQETALKVWQTNFMLICREGYARSECDDGLRFLANETVPRLLKLKEFSAELRLEYAIAELFGEAIRSKETGLSLELLENLRLQLIQHLHAQPINVRHTHFGQDRGRIEAECERLLSASKSAAGG
jgi:hypothetical protein